MCNIWVEAQTSEKGKRRRKKMCDESIEINDEKTWHHDWLRVGNSNEMINGDEVSSIADDARER